MGISDSFCHDDAQPFSATDPNPPRGFGRLSSNVGRHAAETVLSGGGVKRAGVASAAHRFRPCDWQPCRVTRCSHGGSRVSALRFNRSRAGDVLAFHGTCVLVERNLVWVVGSASGLLALACRPTRRANGRLTSPLTFVKHMSESNLVDQTDALLRAIGHTVVRFQQVEQWLAEELALLLRMREKDDQYLVSAAISFKQKVDLLVEIFPRRAERHPNLPKVDVTEVRKALYAAEEYRNRVVHSFYAVECDDSRKWVRMKGALRGRSGFSLNSVDANV